MLYKNNAKTKYDEIRMPNKILSSDNLKYRQALITDRVE